MTYQPPPNQHPPAWGPPPGGYPPPKQPKRAHVVAAVAAMVCVIGLCGVGMMLSEPVPPSVGASATAASAPLPSLAPPVASRTVDTPPVQPPASPPVAPLPIATPPPPAPPAEPLPAPAPAGAHVVGETWRLDEIEYRVTSIEAWRQLGELRPESAGTVVILVRYTETNHSSIDSRAFDEADNCTVRGASGRTYRISTEAEGSAMIGLRMESDFVVRSLLPGGSRRLVRGFLLPEGEVSQPIDVVFESYDVRSNRSGIVRGIPRTPAH